MESLNIESIDVGLCNRLIDLCDKAIALWKAWHGKGSKTLLRQDEKKGEEAQQPSPMSPEVIIIAIKCVFKTKQGNVLNNLESAPPQTLISFGKNLREIIQREPERLGAGAFLNSIEHRTSLQNGGHLDQCMDAIIKTINTQFRLVKDMLMQFFNEDKASQAPISLDMLRGSLG